MSIKKPQMGDQRSQPRQDAEQFEDVFEQELQAVLQHTPIVMDESFLDELEQEVKHASAQAHSESGSTGKSWFAIVQWFKGHTLSMSAAMAMAVFLIVVVPVARHQWFGSEPIAIASQRLVALPMQADAVDPNQIVFDTEQLQWKVDTTQIASTTVLDGLQRKQQADLAIDSVDVPEEVTALIDSLRARPDVREIVDYYNPYGDGQYVVVWSEQQSNSNQQYIYFKYWIPRTGWQEVISLYKRWAPLPINDDGITVAEFEPIVSITALRSGYIQLFWNDPETDVQMIRQYNPRWRRWMSARSRPTQYWEETLVAFHTVMPIQSSLKKRHLAVLERDDGHVVVRRWHIGTDPTGGDALLLPEGYRLVQHTVEDGIYAVLLLHDGQYYSLIESEAAAFRGNE